MICLKYKTFCIVYISLIRTFMLGENSNFIHRILRVALREHSASYLIVSHVRLSVDLLVWSADVAL